MQKSIKVTAMAIAAIIIAGIFLLPPAILLFSSLEWRSNEIVHKTMNYGNYDIVIISRHHSPRLSCNRELYAEIWSNRKKVHSHFITRLDAPDDYGHRIKDIAILPDTGEIRVECDHCFRDKSVSGVELYKIAGD